MLSKTVIVLLIFSHSLSFTLADFPFGELKDIIEKNTIDVKEKDIVGTWINVYGKVLATQRSPASYFVFVKNDDNTLKMEMVCYTPSALEDESEKVTQVGILKRKDESDSKGIFRSEYPDTKGGTLIMESYFFYVDKNVQGLYNCLVDDAWANTGLVWDLSISIAADKKADLLAETGGQLNDVQLSVYKAVQKFNEIRVLDDKYLKAHPDEKLSLFTEPTTFYNYAELRP